MLAAVERWGGGRTSGPTFRAPSPTCAAAAGELEFLLEDVGPGTRRLAEPGRARPVAARAAGPRLRPRRGGRAPLLVGGGIGIVAARRAAGSARPRPALLGFRDAAHAAGAALLDDVALATDDGSAGTAASSPSSWRARSTGTTRRALRLRAAGDARGGPPMCVERRVPAQLALESGMACGFGACFGCVVPDPRRLRARLRRRAGAAAPPSSRRCPSRDHDAVRDRARAPGHQRVGHVRRDRRAADLRRRGDRALPLQRLRLEDRSPSSPARATRRRGSGRRRPA